MYKTFAVVVLCVVLCIAAVMLLSHYSRDQDLSPQVQLWLQVPPIESIDSSNGYVYLLGILADEQTNPQEAGLAVIETYRRPKIDLAFLSESAVIDESFPQLELPSHDLLCNKGESGCLERVLAGKDQLAMLVGSNNIWLQRYSELLRKPAYSTLPETMTSDLEPRYPAITVLNRLNHLVLVRHLLSNRLEEFAQALLNDLESIRAFMARADDFRLKQTLALALVEDLKLLVQLYSRGYLKDGLISPEYPVFNKLSIAERTLEYDMKRKFYLHARKVRIFGGENPGAEGALNPLAGSVGILFKRNRTLNEVLPRFARNYELSILPPDEYLEYLKKPFSLSSVIHRDNRVGGVLNRGAVSNLQGYIGVFNDIDCFIKLVRIRLSLPVDVGTAEVDFEALGMDIDNPYTGLPPSLDTESDQMCFTTRGTNKICIEL